MLDDQKQKLILGTLLVATLGMGSWYFVFRDGDRGRETPLVSNSGDKRFRHPATLAKGEKSIRVRQPAAPLPTRVKTVRPRGGPVSCGKRDRYENDKRRKIRKKITTPLAVIPLREASRFA